jgi:predicted  nucleic acid-binding Zn-ribbon protein
MKTMKTVAFAAVSVLAAAWAFAQTESIKESERFIKAGEETSQAVADARLKTKNALDAYNALVQGDSKDMKDDYKKLQKAQKDMNNQVADGRKTIAEMDKQAAVYFAARSSALAQIQDTAMRDQAKSRLDESKKEYDKVRAALKNGGDTLAPFTKDLSDQIKYLSAELTPSAAASLKPQAEKLNKQGATLLAHVDDAVATGHKYFTTLKPE